MINSNNFKFQLLQHNVGIKPHGSRYSWSVQSVQSDNSGYLEVKLNLIKKPVKPYLNNPPVHVPGMEQYCIKICQRWKQVSIVRHIATADRAVCCQKWFITKPKSVRK